MKKRTVFLGVLLLALCATAVVIFPFPGWGSLTKKSRDIVVARCTKTPQPGFILNGMLASDMEVLYVLKGTNRLGPAVLESQYWPRQGETYLIFGGYMDDGCYNAVEDYRVVPIGMHFATNGIAGKTLDEQLQILFKSRLWDLNRELEKGQEEKKRLEEALKK